MIHTPLKTRTGDFNKVALQIFQTYRKLHRPKLTGRGGALRAEAEATVLQLHTEICIETGVKNRNGPAMKSRPR